ncbi:sugar phosphate isomerase/epimerase family protein [Bythopirellula polymerisocia]|uniref:Xylose isomerase-like TIM barrel n=1 Tax=Bythopirellula polymerisocia TaxID=2528003 RepID=A0A5C6CNI3_9BACT|nr:sugar phosphate isomerase/epimerase family protein [Bythopirellula polymerisocia]TWU26002.1 Xylose isomerase-like TIM barrel [Bythopirellula polymerisocia]
MPHSSNRRDFLSTVSLVGAGAAFGGLSTSLLHAAEESSMPFKISVAEYSLHKMIGKGELDPRDFGPFCKEHFDVDAVEYWMGPFADKAQDLAYMDEMHQKSEDAGVKGLLIMCDIPNGEGDLGNPDAAKRQLAVAKHHEWVDAAKQMGCHSIRVNARSQGSPEEQAKLAADGLRKLSEYAAPQDINVIVENHGGLSSDGTWLAGVIRSVNLPNCGTLPDFGNFQTSPGVWYDKYKGVEELMPYAKAVSAKSHIFDEDGNESEIDYLQMMKIVTDAGYHGYVGIEWEGAKPESEVEGVLLTKRLLERVRDQIT